MVIFKTLFLCVFGQHLRGRFVVASTRSFVLSGCNEMNIDSTHEILISQKQNDKFSLRFWISSTHSCWPTRYSKFASSLLLERSLCFISKMINCSHGNVIIRYVKHNNFAPASCGFRQL